MVSVPNTHFPGCTLNPLLSSNFNTALTCPICSSTFAYDMMMSSMQQRAYTTPLSVLSIIRRKKGGAFFNPYRTKFHL